MAITVQQKARALYFAYLALVLPFRIVRRYSAGDGGSTSGIVEFAALAVGG